MAKSKHVQLLVATVHVGEDSAMPTTKTMFYRQTEARPSVCSPSYPVCKVHASNYVFIRGLPGSTIYFPHYLTNETTFGNKVIEHEKLWFDFPYNL